MRIPLVGGSYSARSIIASCQRCINLYPESNPKDSLVPVTTYQRPGLVAVAQGLSAKPVRLLYAPSNGIGGYAVVGQDVFYIRPDWTMQHLGSLTAQFTNPCSMIDNGVNGLLVDGSGAGYTIDLATKAFGTLSDPTGTFNGANRVDIIDGFVLWNMPGTQQFGSALNDVTFTFDPLYFASKNNYPDPLHSLVVWKHQILLLGLFKGEIWYDAGNPTFPFAELPGSSIEHGLAARYSLASQDICAYWLAQNLQGTGTVLKQKGYNTVKISSYALDEQIRKMAKTGTIRDAIGYVYQQGGHVFYVLTFPTGDQTWVYDESIGDPELAWHQRGWTDSEGMIHRDRTNCFAFINDSMVVGDHSNGQIYKMDLDRYSDTFIDGSKSATSYIRTFPHFGIGKSPDGQPMMADGKRIQIFELMADVECGEAPKKADGTPATINLRVSRDRGKTFDNTVQQTLGGPGEYLLVPKWAPLGIARDWVIEISYDADGPVALNGAWVEADVLDDNR